MAFTQGHALLVGVGTYRHIPQSNVPISVEDADGVRAVLQDVQRCGYPAEQVAFLHDEKATRQGLLDAFKALAGTASPDSTVIFFYVGHGHYGTDGEYYLTTHDTQLEGGKVKKGSGVSELELLERLRAIQAKRVLVIVNSCHSGELSPNLEFDAAKPTLGEDTLPEKTMAALLSTGEGRIIITACRPQQKSWIGSGKMSLFTQAVVDGLRGEGYVTNNQGYISAFGLYEHVYFAAKESAARLGKEQEPELTVLRGVGPFPVALYRGATDLGSFDAGEPLPETAAARQVDPALSKRLYEQAARQITIAAGERSVAIGGSVMDSTIITGDGNVLGSHNISQVVKAEGGGTIRNVTQVAGNPPVKREDGEENEK
jgi:hypothetical protein